MENGSCHFGQGTKFKPAKTKLSVTRLDKTHCQFGGDTSTVRSKSQLDENEMVRFTLQIGQRTSETSFLIVNNLATDTNFWTACINESSELICSKKSALKCPGSSPFPKKKKALEVPLTCQTAWNKKTAT